MDPGSNPSDNAWAPTSVYTEVDRKLRAAQLDRDRVRQTPPDYSSNQEYDSLPHVEPVEQISSSSSSSFPLSFLPLSHHHCDLHRPVRVLLYRNLIHHFQRLHHHHQQHRHHHHY